LGGSGTYVARDSPNCRVTKS